MPFDLVLPGRDPDPEDFQAQDALMTLFSAESIKTSEDEDLFDRMQELLDNKLATFERVNEILSQLRSGDDSEAEQAMDFIKGDADRTDSRTQADFFARLNKARNEEMRKNLQPLRG